MSKRGKTTFIDLFSGIGGFRIALEKNGCKCIGFSDIYAYAVNLYKDKFDTSQELEIGDITKNHDLPYADIITGGVPCQSWSIAGKKRGFEDPRGRLWLDTIEVVKKVKPKAFIFENVKGLADPRNKANLMLIVSELEGAGYRVRYKVLNAFDYGLPQSRERIFIVGIRNDINSTSFEYPMPHEELPVLADILTDSRGKVKKKTNHHNSKNSFNMAAIENKGNFFIFSDVRNGEYTVHSWDLIETTPLEKKICMLIMKNRRKPKYGNKDGNPMSLADIQELLEPKFDNPSLFSDYNDTCETTITQADIDGLVKKGLLKPKDDKYDLANSRISSGLNGIYRIFLPESHVFSTLTKSGTRDFVSTESIPGDVENKKAYFLENIYWKKKYRPITVREAARIQGFPDSYNFEVSTSVAMGLLGNSIAINIVSEIVKEVLSVLEKTNEKMA